MVKRMNNNIDVALAGKNTSATSTNIKAANEGINSRSTAESASTERSFEDSIQQAYDASKSNNEKPPSEQANEQSGKHLPEKGDVSAKPAEDEQSPASEGISVVEQDTVAETALPQNTTLQDQSPLLEGVGSGLIDSVSIDHVRSDTIVDVTLSQQASQEASQQAALAAQQLYVKQNVAVTGVEATAEKIQLLIPQAGQQPITRQQQIKDTTQPQILASSVETQADPDVLLANTSTVTSTVLSSQAMMQAQQGQQAIFTQALTAQLESNTQATLSTSVAVPIDSDTEGLSLLANTALNTASTLSSSPVAQGAISEAFAKPGWSQGMGKQIMFMVNQNISSAEIRLNPAHLGPIEVLIDMSDDQVNVSMTSRHAVVREAMEQALPKLREMLDENGFNLADADISKHSFSDQREQNTESDDNGNISRDSLKQLSASETGEKLLTHAGVATGVVDYYI